MINTRDTSLKAVGTSILALSSRDLDLAAVLHTVFQLDVERAHVGGCLDVLALNLFAVDRYGELCIGHVLACLNAKALYALNIHGVKLWSLGIALLAQIPNLGLAGLKRHGNRITLSIAVLRSTERASVRGVGFNDRALKGASMRGAHTGIELEGNGLLAS